MLNTTKRILADTYKKAIVLGLRSGELSRVSATLEYLQPFCGAGIFEDADLAEITAVMDEVAPVEVPDVPLPTATTTRMDTLEGAVMEIATKVEKLTEVKNAFE